MEGGSETKKSLSELDLVDKRILYHLSKNSRQSYKDVAKKIGKNHRFVQKKYMELAPYIKRYMPVVGYQHLGYTTITFYIQLTGSIKNIDKIIESVKYLPEVNIIIKTQGGYDLIVGTLFKTTKDIYEGIKNIRRDFGDNIRVFDTLIHIGASYFGHRYLNPESEKKILDIPFTGDWTKEQKVIHMNNNKNKILKVLATNANIRNDVIAQETGLNPIQVRKIIRDMEEERLIEEYSFVPNSPDIYRIFVRLYNANEDVINKFRQFGYLNIETIQVVRTIGMYTLFYDIYAPNNFALMKWSNQLKKELGDYIVEQKITNLWYIERFTYYHIDPKVLKRLEEKKLKNVFHNFDKTE